MINLRQFINKKILFILVIFIGFNFSYAQENSPSEKCDLSGFLTYGQGAWGSPSQSTPGKLRDNNFSAVFPEGLTIGSTFTLQLNSVEALSAFLPQRRTPSKFEQDYIDPHLTSAGVLGGQLVSALLNYHFNLTGILGNNSEYSLGELVIAAGPFEGKTVEELLAFANTAIGGEETPYSYSQINDALTLLNENFNNSSNRGFLECPPSFIKTKEPLSSLGDKVWLDPNWSGTQESWETGIAGVSIKLFDCNDLLVAETVTDADGNYLFEYLNSGDYYIRVIPPDGYYFSNADQGIDDETDSDIDPSTERTPCVNLSDGNNNFSVDAGLYCTNGLIGDKVWLDLNKDGRKNLTEVGVGDVVVKLFDCEGILKDETSTNADGCYNFENVKPGFYKIQFVLPEGYSFTLMDQGLSDNIDSDAGADGFTICTELAAYENDKSWDAGLILNVLNEGIGFKNLEYVNKLSPGENSNQAEFNLLQNYPNPFNPSTIIEFNIPVDGNYIIRLYNLLGQEIKILFNDNLGAGRYSLRFNGEDLLSGTYFYNLSGNGVNLTRKMILVK